MADGLRVIVGSALHALTRIRAGANGQFRASCRWRRPTLAGVKVHRRPRRDAAPAQRPRDTGCVGVVRLASRLCARAGAGFALAAASLAAMAQAAVADVPDAALREQLRATLQQAAAAHPGVPPGARTVVELGRLDARLRLAPCERIEPQWPASAWGAVRVGLRCTAGPTRWHVHLPATVQVLAPGWVAAADLAAGTELAPAHLRRAEVDLAAGGVVEQPLLLGRTLARPLAAGAPVRTTDLRARQWFAAGDVVQVVAVGRGYRVSGQGQAMAPGIEGQRVRVRTDSGRIVTGVPVAPSRVEVTL